MLKKLKAENEAKEAKSKEADNSKNSKTDKESGLAKTDEKVRKALESSEKKSSEKNPGSDDISDKTRALLESKDTSKAAPPPPPPKKPKDLSDSSPDSSSVRARKSVSLGSLIGKKDTNKENGDKSNGDKPNVDKPTKRSSSDKRNTNSPTGKVQSKMTSFVTKDDKKDRTTGTCYFNILVTGVIESILVKRFLDQKSLRFCLEIVLFLTIIIIIFRKNHMNS